jgi:hypothetical protein
MRSARRLMAKRRRPSTAASRFGSYRTPMSDSSCGISGNSVPRFIAFSCGASKDVS